MVIIQITIVASSSYLMLRRLCPLYGNDRRVTLSLNVAFFVTYLIVTVMSLVASMEVARKAFSESHICILTLVYSHSDLFVTR
jgi:hypothetical protein